MSVTDLAINNFTKLPTALMNGLPFAVGFGILNAASVALMSMLPEMSDPRMEMLLKSFWMGATDTAKFAYWDGTDLDPPKK